MAIAFDQALGSATSASAASVSITTTAAAAANSRVVVCMSYFQNAPRNAPTCTIGGTGATLDKDFTNGSDYYSIFSLVLGGGGLANGSTITVTQNGAGGSGGTLAAACSYTGTTGTATSASQTGTTSASWSTGSATNAVADALFVGGAGTDGSMTSESSTPTNGNERFDLFVAAASQGMVMQDLIVSSIAAQALTGTWANTTGLTTQTGAVMVYKGTASSATGPQAIYLPRRAYRRPPFRGPLWQMRQTQWAPVSTGPVANVSNLTATLSFTGAKQLFVSKLLAAVLSFTGSLLKLVGKPLAATLSFTGAVAVRTGKALAAVLSFTGAQSRLIGKALAAALSFTGSLLRAIVHGFTAVLSFTGSLTKLTAHGMTAVLSFNGAVAAARFFTKAFSATLSFTGAKTLQVGKLLAGVLSFTGFESGSVPLHLDTSASTSTTSLALTAQTFILLDTSASTSADSLNLFTPGGVTTPERTMMGVGT